MTYTADHPVDGDDIQTALSTYINQNLTHIVAAINQEHVWSDSDATATIHDATLFKKYVGSATRAMTAASGDVDYTGIGFTPHIILFFGAYSSDAFSIGGYDGTRSRCFSIVGTTASVVTTGVLSLPETTLKYQLAAIKTVASGQFTLTWTKSDDEPASATKSFIYVCLGFQS